MKSHLELFIKNFDDVNYVNWFQRLTNTVVNLFEYDGVPESLDVYFMELYMHLAPMGICGVYDDYEHGIIAINGNRGGEVDAYGMGKYFIGTIPMKSYQLDINDPKLIIAHNNCSYLSDFGLIDKYANMLNEVDKSLNSLVIYSRMHPIPRVKNDADVKQFNTIFKNILSGKIGSVMKNDDKLSELVGDGDVEIVNYTDVNASTKIAELTRLRDSILQNFLREIGITCNQINKAAQVNNLELQSYDNYTNLNLWDYYNSRVKMCEEINEKLGCNMSVKINEMLINQILQKETNQQFGKLTL